MSFGCQQTSSSAPNFYSVCGSKEVVIGMNTLPQRGWLPLVPSLSQVPPCSPCNYIKIFIEVVVLMFSFL